MGNFDREAILKAAESQAAKQGRVLDYSDGSIAVLDELLDFYREYFEENRLSEQTVWNLAVLFGTYLGETLLRNGLAGQGYGWQLTGDGLPVLERDSANQMSPITKAEKRIKNGPEDSVKSFYDVAKVIAEGKLIPEKREKGRDTRADRGEAT